MSNTQLGVALTEFYLLDCWKKREEVFWQLWKRYQNYLYRRCLKWMGGNPADAEEALSRAMLKAWEKSRDYAHAIANFKAWLTRLTHNICVDIRRESKRLAHRVESWDLIAQQREEQLVSQSHTPENAAMRSELEIVIHRAIEELPPRLRQPFILHFIEEKSYQDISQQLGISYDNLCKRISQARAILQKRLKPYLSGLDVSPFDSSDPFRKKAKSGVEKLPYSSIRAEVKIPPTFNQKERFGRSPNYYQITAICLETLAHAWYQSPSPLGWS
ncbi:RNA polymerase sigma factor [Aerosakkonema funiforme]|nr:sigma-70 family RNA polymerase sigma factor [Aerosakkonema funiforme]